MTKWAIKRFVIGFLLSTLGLIVFFWIPISEVILSQYLKYQIRQQFSAELSFQRIAPHPKGWMIERPQIIHHEMGEVHADKILLAYDLQLFRRQINLDIEVISPSLEIKPVSSSESIQRLAVIPSFSWPRLGLLKVSGNIVIEQGCLSVQTQELEQSAPKVFFNFEGCWGVQRAVHSAFWLENQDNHRFEVSLIRLDKAQSLHFNAQQIAMQSAYPIIQKIWPIGDHWTISEGILDGSLLLQIDANGKLQADGKLQIEQLQFEHADLQLTGSIPKANFQIADGNGKLFLSPVASFTKYEGQQILWCIDEMGGEMEFPFTQTGKISLHGHCMHQGRSEALHIIGNIMPESQKADVNVTWGSLGGKLALDLTLSEQLQLQMHADMQDIVPFFPKQMNCFLSKIGENKNGTLGISVAYAEKGLHVNGNCILSEPGQVSDAISYTAELECSALAEFRLRKGRFQASHLPIARYCDPQIIFGGGWTWSGLADLEGVFDENSLIVHYDVRELQLNNSYLTIEVPQLSDSNGIAILPAVHYIDFVTGKHGGMIPITNGSFLDRQTKLQFTDISTEIILDQDSLSANNLEAYCHGIYMAGGISTDYSSKLKNIWAVDIHAHTINGPISQIQELFGQLNPSMFSWKYPLEGNVSLRQRGGHLHLAFNGEEISVQGTLQGTISEAACLHPHLPIALYGLNADFDYDYSQNRLDFSEIQGVLLAGPPDKEEEYLVVGDRVRLLNLANQQMDFDIWVGDKNRDILRLAGETRPIYADGKVSHIELLLDQRLSHFGDMHPKACQLVIKNGGQIENLHLELGFRLDNLLGDVHRLIRTDLLLPSWGFLKNWHPLKASGGDCQISIDYDNAASLLTYQASGNDLYFDKYRFHHCVLNGKKKGNIWTIDQLQLDDVSFAAELSPFEQNWRVNFLGIRCGESVLLGLEGKFLPEYNMLDAKVNLLEINLDYIEEWPALHAMVAAWNLKGDLRASGHIKACWRPERPKWNIDLLLNSSWRNGELHQIAFQDIDNFSLHFLSDKHLTVRNVSGIFKKEPISFNLACLDFDLTRHELAIDKMQLHIPATQLAWVMQKLQDAFPNYITAQTGHLVSQIKNKGSVEASISWSPQQNKGLQLVLEEGMYHWQGSDVHLGQIVINSYPMEMHLSTEYKNGGSPLWISVRTGWPSIDAGELVITDSSSSTALNMPLKINWKYRADQGVAIQKVEGSCAGVTASLNQVMDDSQQIHLAGELMIDPSLAGPFMLPQVKDIISDCQLSGSYKLKGHWTLPCSDFAQWKHNVCFSGLVNASSCGIMGYSIDSLSAEVLSTPASIQISSLELQDKSGSLTTEKMEILRDETHFGQFTVPLLTLSYFRPSDLRPIDSQQNLLESTFVIRKLELKEFTGNLFDRSTFCGSGLAYCANPPSREKPNPIWTIPSEMLSALGLDLAALSPVSGIVHYRIDNRKVYLTKFKEMYSAGRLSKFYLPKNPAQPFYIDFDGNVFVQVRMRQHNLAFKIAELFTVTIQGSLFKPTYSLLKIRDDHSEDLISYNQGH